VTAENCAASIDKRDPSNEWHVQDYVPVGIFILPPITVRQIQRVEGFDEPISGEIELRLDQAVAPFPDERIFTVNKETFLELDRSTGRWNAVAYDDIIPARPAACAEITSK
jgi:hypothetical protein